MSVDYSAFRGWAEGVSREAGALLLRAYGRVSAREKGPADLVTEADLASQRLIAERLGAAFPDHTLLAEEDGHPTDYQKPFRWVVDPLDGTMNFAHGFPFWCVSIGLEHAGELVVGVVHNPLMNQTFSAWKGGGAWCDGRRIRVSEAAGLRQSLVAAALPTDFAADAGRQSAYLRRFSTGTHTLRRSGSSALNLAYVAAGAFEVSYGTHLNSWDAAAGVVLVREAGGRVSRLDGSPFDLYGGETLATNGRVHDEAVAALRDAWPET